MKSQQRIVLQACMNSLTPLQRRLVKRAQKRAKQLRWGRVCGVVLGLSVSSLILANATQGTHALLTGQAVNTQNQFSAAKHFQSYDDDLAGKVESAADSASQSAAQANQALTALQKATTVSEAASLLESVKVAVGGAETAISEALAYKGQIDQVAAEDLQDYQTAESQAKQASQKVQQIQDEITAASQTSNGSIKNLSVALNQAESSAEHLQTVADSFQRVMSWSALADGRASQAIQAAQSAVDTAAGDVKSAGDAIAEMKKIEETKTHSDTNKVVGQNTTDPVNSTNPPPKGD